MERFLKVFPWACTVILFGFIFYDAGMYRYITKLVLDMNNVKGMVTRETNCDGSDCPAAKTSSAPNAVLPQAATVNPDDVAYVACFREARTRPARGLPAITELQAIDWCCGSVGTPGRDQCASLVNAP
ncbi:MAG: hypothetical protein WC457_00505 [Patescibacteria group bacterium]